MSILSTDSVYSVTKCDNKFCSCEDTNSVSSESNSFVEDNKNDFEESDNYEEELAEKKIQKLSLWDTILEESQKKITLLYKWQQENKEMESKKIINSDDSPADYLNNKIFPILLPAMEKMLIEASRWNAIENPKCQFSGLDYLAEYLWNKNPKYPQRNTDWLQLFEIPGFKLWLREHPRPIYPKSWLWTKDQAVLYIQRYVRGWIVRKRDDVQELRQFWKALNAESDTETIKSIDKSLTESDVFKPEKMQKLNICERYKLLTQLYFKS